MPPDLKMGFQKRPPITGTLIGNVHLAAVGMGKRNHNCRKVVLTFLCNDYFHHKLFKCAVTHNYNQKATLS